jgi:UrcA family protein
MKSFQYTNRIAVLTIVALSVALFTAQVHADEPYQGAASRAVRYRDLNLDTDAGAKVLYRRIYYAAVQVCGDPFSRQLDQAAAAKACVDKAIASSVHALDSAQLARTAYAHGYAVKGANSMASVR